MGNGNYFRTSQIRTKDKRKAKDFAYQQNYVDRVRLAAEDTLQHIAAHTADCPSRNSGWRQTPTLKVASASASASASKSISHLDLATSCHGTAAALDHKLQQYKQELNNKHWSVAARQLRNARSLEYKREHICEEEADALNIAEFYWHFDPEAHEEFGNYTVADDYNNYTHSQKPAAAAAAAAATLNAYDFGSDSCSLRRSRSLAIIREETFSDLQINSANSNRRRSQLIPRARLVNRGFFREHQHQRLIYNNNKHHQHYYQNHSSVTKEVNAGAVNNISGVDTQSKTSVLETCDSHQQQQQQQQQQQTQQLQQHKHTQYIQQHHQLQQQQHQPTSTQREFDVYYKNLKRLDALTLGLAAAEQLHPWHNDKSDLESLNSDYFKNSLHQNHELKQQQQQQLQQQYQKQLEFEVLEQAVNRLSKEKPRIYQSRKQKQQQNHTRAIDKSAHNGCIDSCPETSQSSVFPETTTSNSDDQTDSASLSEQEYDLTHIEEIYQKTRREGDEESYELISLTTTTRTHFDTTEEEVEEEDEKEETSICSKRAIKADTENNQDRITSIALYTENRTNDEQLEKLIAYDSVYLSSEESSESTLIGENCETFKESTITASGLKIGELETRSLLQISIEDTIFDATTSKKDNNTNEVLVEERVTKVVESADTKIEYTEQTTTKGNATNETPQSFTQVLKLEHTPGTNTTVGVTSSAASKPKILSVVEKRKLKRYSECAQKELLEEHADLNCSNKHCLQLQRPATDTHYVLHKTNLIDNQYHSLPDVNIGESLKVSECIDAELRSSYNLQKYQRAADVKLAEKVTRQQQQQQQQQRQQQQEVITREEIYDSIKRFGRAHQQARQLEYNELHEHSDVESEPELKRTEVKENHTNFKINAIEILQPIAQVQEDYTAPIITLETTETVEQTEATKRLIEGQQQQLLQTNVEQNKTEFTNIEVANFSKLIKKRAAEIRKIVELKKQLQNSSDNHFKSSKSNQELETIQFDANANQDESNTFCIIVTDAQNNIIEENSIECITGQTPKIKLKQQQVHVDTPTTPPTEPAATITTKVTDVTLTKSIQDNSPTANNRVKSLKRCASKLKRQTYHQVQQQKEQNHEQQPAATNSNNNSNHSELIKKTWEHRILNSNTPIYKARPIKVLTPNDSFRRNVSFNGRGRISARMSRPQILHIVDNSGSGNGNNSSSKNHSLRRASSTAGKPKPRDGTINDTTTTSLGSNAKYVSNQVEKEYLQKVDAVRWYWSKLAKRSEQNEQQQQQQQAVQKVKNIVSPVALVAEPKINSNVTNAVKDADELSEKLGSRNFMLGSMDSNSRIHSAQTDSSQNSTTHTDYLSYMPSIEIVELGDGEKKATIVSAVPENEATNLNANEPQFDHIRYKVLKSKQLLRNNILMTRNKKEAQFDGLIQYLQEYSFQELLSNNNVVIVEPVRTKIEQPLMIRHNANKQDTKQASGRALERRNENAAKVNVNCTTNGNSVKSNAGSSRDTGGGGVLKKHFFYQPVRVNRELYEDELPDPDTVRNVRKFFEQHILPTSGQGLLTNAKKFGSAIQLSPKTRRARKYRYLTIDTSYSGAATAAEHVRQDETLAATTAINVESNKTAKWETASLSSGISSGDCEYECIEAATTNPTAALNTKQQLRQQRNTDTIQSACKNVHVQEVVRRHNSTAANARAKARANSLVAARCPWSGINGSTAISTSRNMYKHNLNCKPEHAVGEHVLNDDNDDDDEDDDDLFGFEGMDDENDLCESYYVSNDVLQKIREYGSTVTYYGGRVLNSTTPEPRGGLQRVPSQYQDTVNCTRARVRQIEACNVCLPSLKCAHQMQSTSKSNASNKPDTYQGIKFKLVKSNSCSSRLELAGATEIVEQTTAIAATAATAATMPTDQLVLHDIENGKCDDVAATDAEVVRKMVNRFESNQQQNVTPLPTNDTHVTINSQTVHNKIDTLPDRQLPVTVNNHINVTGNTELLTENHAKNATVKREGFNIEFNADKMAAHTSSETYQSSALDIHLCAKLNPGNGNTKNNNNVAINGVQKVCRNKNVDLAYTLVKKQQHPLKSIETFKVIEKTHTQPSATNPIEAEANQRQSAQEITNQSVDMKKSETHVLHCNKLAPITKNIPFTLNDSFENNLAECNVTKVDMLLPSQKFTMHEPLPTIRMINEAKAAQLIVPVEIHQQEKGRQQRRTSNASSCNSIATIIDKNVVRHYVANDKSLFERRKYDDIEFEEFEVYDPAKDYEHITLSCAEQRDRRTKACHDEMTSTAATDSAPAAAVTAVGVNNNELLYDSLDDKL